MRNEPGVMDSIWYGVIVLFGEQDKDWEYIETDEDWWTVKLWIRRN
ncbi:hypothetical protein ES703_15819 [subsurface metagenome]